MTFGFYRFIAVFAREPTDPDDFFAGLAVIGAMQELEDLRWQKT
jgi:hypothetical protein